MDSQVPALADTVDNRWLLGKGKSLFFRGLLLVGLTDSCGWPHTQEQHKLGYFRERRERGGGERWRVDFGGVRGGETWRMNMCKAYSLHLRGRGR